MLLGFDFVRQGTPTLARQGHLQQRENQCGGGEWRRCRASSGEPITTTSTTTTTTATTTTTNNPRKSEEPKKELGTPKNHAHPRTKRTKNERPQELAPRTRPHTMPVGQWRCPAHLFPGARRTAHQEPKKELRTQERTRHTQELRTKNERPQELAPRTRPHTAPHNMVVGGSLHYGFQLASSQGDVRYLHRVDLQFLY